MKMLVMRCTVCVIYQHIIRDYSIMYLGLIKRDKSYRGVMAVHMLHLHLLTILLIHQGRQETGAQLTAFFLLNHDQKKYCVYKALHLDDMKRFKGITWFQINAYAICSTCGDISFQITIATNPLTHLIVISTEHTHGLNKCLLHLTFNLYQINHFLQNERLIGI